MDKARVGTIGRTIGNIALCDVRLLGKQLLGWRNGSPWRSTGSGSLAPSQTIAERPVRFSPCPWVAHPRHQQAIRRIDFQPASRWGARPLDSGKEIAAVSSNITSNDNTAHVYAGVIG